MLPAGKQNHKIPSVKIEYLNQYFYLADNLFQILIEAVKLGIYHDDILGRNIVYMDLPWEK